MMHRIIWLLLMCNHGLALNQTGDAQGIGVNQFSKRTNILPLDSSKDAQGRDNQISKRNDMLPLNHSQDAQGLIHNQINKRTDILPLDKSKDAQRRGDQFSKRSDSLPLNENKDAEGLDRNQINKRTDILPSDQNEGAQGLEENQFGMWTDDSVSDAQGPDNNHFSITDGLDQVKDAQDENQFSMTDGLNQVKDAQGVHENQFSLSEGRELADLDLRPFVENFYSSKYHSRILSPNRVRPHRQNKPVFVSVNNIQQPGLNNIHLPESGIDHRYINKLKQRHNQLQQEYNQFQQYQTGNTNQQMGMYPVQHQSQVGVQSSNVYATDQAVVPASNYVTRLKGNRHPLPSNQDVNNYMGQMQANTKMPSNQDIRDYMALAQLQGSKYPLPSNQEVNNYMAQLQGNAKPLPSNHEEDDAGGYVHSLVQIPSKYHKGVLTYFQGQNRPEVSLWAGSFPQGEKSIEIWTRNPNVALDTGGGGESNVPGYSIFPTGQTEELRTPKKKYKIKKVKFPSQTVRQMFVTNGNKGDANDAMDVYKAHSHHNFVTNVNPRHKNVPNQDETDHENEADTIRNADQGTSQDKIEEFHKKWKSKHQQPPRQNNHEFQTKPDTMENQNEHQQNQAVAIPEPGPGTRIPQDDEEVHMKSIQALIKDMSNTIGNNTSHFINNVKRDNSHRMRKPANLNKPKKSKVLKRKRKVKQVKTQETKNNEADMDTKSNAGNNDKTRNVRQYKTLNRTSSVLYNDQNARQNPNAAIRLIPVDVNTHMMNDAQGKYLDSNSIHFPNYYTSDNNDPSYKVIGMKNVNPTKTPTRLPAHQSYDNSYQNNILGDLGYSLLLLKDKNNHYRTIQNDGHHNKDVKVIKMKRKPKRNNQLEQNIQLTRVPNYVNVADIRNLIQTAQANQTMTVKKVKKKPKTKTLTKTVKIKKPLPAKDLPNQNNQGDWTENMMNKIRSNQTFSQAGKSDLQVTSKKKDLTKLTDSAAEGTIHNMVGHTKEMSLGKLGYMPEVAYKVTRNGDGTYETASFQDFDNHNPNNNQDDEEYDTDEDEEDKEGQESSHNGNRRMIENEPEVVEDNKEDKYLRDEEERENNKLREQEKAEDDENQENDDIEDEIVQSDMDFDRIKDDIDRIDEEPDDEEQLEDEEEETLFTPEDYDDDEEEEEDDQNREQTKTKDKNYMLMPFFLKVPKERNRRSTRLALSTTNSKQKTLLPTESKDVAKNGTASKSKWQIPIFVIGSEEKDVKDNLMLRNDMDRKTQHSSIKFNPFWKENTFVKAENEFNIESNKAMNAKKRKDDENKKIMKTSLSNKTPLQKAEEPIGQATVDKSKHASHLNHPDNFKHMFNSDEMYDKNRTEIREKRKMFVLNKNIQENINRNNVAKTEDNELENEKSLINRINTYTYAQIGQQPMTPKIDLNKKVKTPDIAKNTNKTTRKTTNKTTEIITPSTIKTNMKSAYNPVKRFDHFNDGNIKFDEDEEIKKVERINKYMEQNNQMKSNPSFHNVNYTSTRRKFSLYSPAGENLFLKKDNIKEDTRQSIPVSERSDEEDQFSTFKPENTLVQRQILHKVQKTNSKSGKRSSDQIHQANTEKNPVMEKKNNMNRPRIQTAIVKPDSIRNSDQNRAESNKGMNTQPIDKKYRYKIDLTSPRTKIETIDEMKQDGFVQSSSEEPSITTEIKRREPDPVSPDERKNFRKYSKKRVKEVVIKSATEEPIIKTTVKITDESSKYPIISKAAHTKFKPSAKKDEKETIINHVKYERKIKKLNNGNVPSSLFYEMDDKGTTDSIESQESQVYPEIDKATSPSINTYKLAKDSNSDPVSTSSKDDTVHNIQRDNQTALETNNLPKYFKTVIQETASEDSPKTTYYEEIDYKTTMNPNFAKHAKEIRDSLGVPQVNYYDNKIVVTESSKTHDEVTPEGIYEEMFGKKEARDSINESIGYGVYRPKDKKNPMFDTNTHTAVDEYEHQVQKPDLQENHEDPKENENLPNEEYQKVNENPHNEDYVSQQDESADTKNKTLKDLMDNINTYYDMNYEDPLEDGYYRHNSSHLDMEHREVNNTSDETYRGQMYSTTETPSYAEYYPSDGPTTQGEYYNDGPTTEIQYYNDGSTTEHEYSNNEPTTEREYYNDRPTTQHPHIELTDEETQDEHGNIKNHNVNRDRAVFPNKEHQYYNHEDKPYMNDYDGANAFEDHASTNESAENADVSIYNSNPYLNGKTVENTDETPENHGEVFENTEEGGGGEGPRMNYYEEDKKYVSESKKIKNIPEDESEADEEDYDHDQSGNEDYDSGYASSTPADMSVAGQELNEEHKDTASKESHEDDKKENHEHHKKGGDGNYKKETGEKQEHTKKKSKGKKTKETFDNYHEEENAKKGHDKKEKHKKKYHDAKGAKKKHKVEKEHYDKEHEAEEGEKGAKFEESGSHEKGHSTKGEHNIHKVNEYMKKHEFYDEHHDGGEHEKHGGFSEHHDHAKGKKEKTGHRKGKHTSGELGKKGMVDHGKEYKDYKKLAKKEGEKKHRAEKEASGEEGSKTMERKWGKKKGEERR
ncbi:hypothetical protein M8J75_007746 [Diaphorina citri]|nr:hypothetical protein M8J75_007746 [Diaphorina citri]